MNLSVLEPTECAASFADVDLNAIEAATGQKQWFVSTDLDGSVIGQHDEQIPERYLTKFEELGANEQVLGLGVLSNAGADRDSRANYLADQIGEAANQDVVRITSHEVGHPKPHRAMWERLKEVAGVAMSDICYIGDQLPKDIWGGNFAGCGATVLLPPYRVAGEHPFTHYVQRPAEAVARLMIGLPFKAKDIGRLKPEAIHSTSQGYRNLKRISGIGALGFAVAGGVELGDVQNVRDAIAGLFGEAIAREFLKIALVARRNEADQQLEERFRALQK